MAMKWDVSTAITGADTVIFGNEIATYLRKAGGTYWAVGGNPVNQLSDGTVTYQYYPVQMKWDGSTPMDTTNVQTMIIGYQTLFILKSDDTWYGQGNNESGQLARGTIEAVGAVGRYPEPVMWDDSNPMTKANVKEVRAATAAAQFQKPDGSWWAVGINDSGQAVDGTTDNRAYPVPMLWADGTMIGAPPGTFPEDGG